MSNIAKMLRFLLRFAAAILLFPWRLLRSVRRSMTGASVTLLLVAIITLNIVWGYPWTGMFAASISLLVVGWIVSRIMCPRLRVGFSLPTSSPAGEVFSVITHLENRRGLPAMDLGVDFDQTDRSRHGKSRDGKSAAIGFSVLSPAHSLRLIGPSERADLATMVRFDCRGVHRLPDVLVTSLFPFHLFRSTVRYSSDTWIAITPRLISGDEDALSRGMLTALGGWTHKLLAGDAMNYTGSREYQDGMSVRRWDFASWARLGRPIVREFQSPSVQTVSLIIDTAIDPALVRDKAAEQVLERLLSWAATAIIELSKRLIRVRMYVTHEDATTVDAIECAGSTCVDTESYLIRLAAAHRVSAEAADQRVAIILDQVSRSAVLVLTSRGDSQIWKHRSANVTVLRTGTPHDQPSSPTNGAVDRRRTTGSLRSAAMESG